MRCSKVGRTPLSARDPLVALLLEDAQWDEQMDDDSVAGRLDFLFDEARKEAEEVPLSERPPARRNPAPLGLQTRTPKAIRRGLRVARPSRASAPRRPGELAKKRCAAPMKLSA